MRMRALGGWLWLAGSLPVWATPVKHFEVQTREAFQAGTAAGVSVDALGRLQLADRYQRLAGVDEPFVLSAAALPDGWVLGTGNSGKVLKLSRKGSVETLFTAPEPAVFAVRAEADGSVFAATSPKGKVYRIAGGKAEVYFDPGETYIWALERAADGSLLVATGTQGKLYKVSAAGQGSVLYDSPETHLRSLALLPGGDVLVGTAESGLILRLSPDGKARTLYDASQPEIVAFAPAGDGTVWAAAVASEASLLAHETPKAGSSAEASTADAGDDAAVTVTFGDEAEPGAGSPPLRRGAKGGARSQILRLGTDGAVEAVTTLADATVYALLVRDGQLWVGTGVEGKLWTLDGSTSVLAATVDDRQIAALTPEPGGGLALVTTNAGAVYQRLSAREQSGTYTSTVLDAGNPARFGTLHWLGETPAGTTLRVTARSGMSADPDATWSDWAGVASGSEVSLAALPLGRYVQWRAELGSKGGATPRLYELSLAYRQENLRPAIKSFSALDPGQLTVPANFNPGSQAFEPAHPNRDGLFTTLVPADGGDEAGGRTKTLWKHGYQSFKWEASDPNGDALRYKLELQGASGGAWVTVAENIKESYFGFDALALPDGVYRFRLTAGEEPPDAGALAASQVSPPVTIDHTPPALEAVRREGKKLRVTLRDAGSPLRELVLSRAAGPWKPVVPVDGMVDGRSETLELEAPEAGQMVLLRATDAAFNVVTFDLAEILP
ncbi:MAG: hypothetical protein U0002_21280 [Thermoanaerobaculia bacterium]